MGNGQLAFDRDQALLVLEGLAKFLDQFGQAAVLFADALGHLLEHQREGFELVARSLLFELGELVGDRLPGFRADRRSEAGHLLAQESFAPPLRPAALRGQALNLAQRRAVSLNRPGDAGDLVLAGLLFEPDSAPTVGQRFQHADHPIERLQRAAQVRVKDP